MKKVLTIMLAALLVLGMVACSPEAMGGKGTVTLKVAQPYGAKGTADATVLYGASEVQFGDWDTSSSKWKIEYSTDNGSNWLEYSTPIISMNVGEKIKVKCENKAEIGNAAVGMFKHLNRKLL